jgi:hypothetical protein
LDEAVFYAYAVPQPKGFAEQRVSPASAHYDERFGEFVLPYEAVRLSNDPEATLTDFIRTTYAHGARLAGWDPDLNRGRL